MLRTYGETLARELATKVDSIQSGSVALVAGVSPAVPVHVTPSSAVLVHYRNPAGTLGVALCVREIDRAIGSPGSFRITSVKADGSTETLDTSTVDWLLVG